MSRESLAQSAFQTHRDPVKPSKDSEYSDYYQGKVVGRGKIWLAYSAIDESEGPAVRESDKPERLIHLERITHKTLFDFHNQAYKNTPSLPFPDITIQYLPMEEIEAQKTDRKLETDLITRSVAPLGVSTDPLDFIPAGTDSYVKDGQRFVALRSVYPEILADNNIRYAQRIGLSYRTIIYGYENMMHSMLTLPQEEALRADKSIIPDFKLAINRAFHILMRENPNIAQDEFMKIERQMMGRISDSRDRRLACQGTELRLYEPRNSRVNITIGQNVSSSVVWKIADAMMASYIQNLSRDASTKEWFLPPQAWPEKMSDFSRGNIEDVKQDPRYHDQMFDVLFAMKQEYKNLRAGVARRAASQDTMFGGIPVDAKGKRTAADFSPFEWYRLYISNDLPFILRPDYKALRRTSYDPQALAEEIVFSMTGEIIPPQEQPKPGQMYWRKVPDLPRKWKK